MASFAAGGKWQHHPNYEPYLTEMARRMLVDQLQKHYDAMMARVDSGLGFPFNLELLTALRREQGRPDPLLIEISLADPTKLGMDPTAPAVHTGAAADGDWASAGMALAAAMASVAMVATPILPLRWAIMVPPPWVGR